MQLLAGRQLGEARTIRRGIGTIRVALRASQSARPASRTNDPSSGAFLGNYPQAFSHIGVIASGVCLAGACRERTAS